MSDFLLPHFRALEPYVPGEQPTDRRYVKLNTNESPFPPAEGVLATLCEENARQLNLYPDPTAQELRETIAEDLGLQAENVFVGNGSDEVLGFAFLAYADEANAVTIPDVSYGFYKVFARLFRAQPNAVPLNEDFSIPVERFCSVGEMVVLANPNAPTGLALSMEQLERIAASNAGHVVLVDEAYIDFGGESALPLLSRYSNLLIVRTFSKSRSLAGGRLGYALGNKELILDLERIKGSFHPYSVNRLTMAAGIAAIKDHAYFEECISRIRAQRENTAEALRAMGFQMTASQSNFLLAGHPAFSGKEYYEKLKARGILVRYLHGAGLEKYVRITIGSEDEMKQLLQATQDIVREAGA